MDKCHMCGSDMVLVTTETDICISQRLVCCQYIVHPALPPVPGAVKRYFRYPQSSRAVKNAPLWGVLRKV